MTRGINAETNPVDTMRGAPILPDVPPKRALSRHYSDYSAEKLQAIYDESKSQDLEYWTRQLDAANRLVNTAGIIALPWCWRQMSEQKPSVWLVLVPLLMLFVSGAWTLAAISPFTSRPIRSFMLVAATIANVSFLATVSGGMLIYLDVGSVPRVKKVMTFTFLVGTVALIISILLFSIFALLAPSRYLPD